MMVVFLPVSNKLDQCHWDGRSFSDGGDSFELKGCDDVDQDGDLAGIAAC